MKIYCVILALLALIGEIPYKQASDFAVKIDYQFRSRHSDPAKAYEAELKTVNTSPLPYLNVNVEMLKLDDTEVKVRISSNKNGTLYTKKISVGTTIQVPFGYTDDVKDEVSANTYTLTFLNKDKEEVSRIVFLVDKEGTFFVNGEKQGKF